MPEMDKCQLCKWWITTNGVVGECHRNPPRFAETERQEVFAANQNSGSVLAGLWPVTRAEDWCGDYLKK